MGKYTNDIAQMILSLHGENKTPVEISKVVRVTSNGVRLFLKRNSLVPHIKPKRDRSRLCVICSTSFIPLYDDGINKDGCKTCSQECLSKLFASYKIKYTQEQINQIIELKKQNTPNKIICEITRVNINKVKEIVKNNNLYLTPEQIQKNAHAARVKMGDSALPYEEYHKTLELIEKEILEGKGTAHGLAEQYGLNPNSVTTVFRREDKNHLLGIKESTGQKALYNFISDLLSPESVLYNDRTIITPKELDVCIPSKMIGFEYNGLHWHTEKFVGKSAHYNKMKFANQKGIRLLTIFEHEWVHRNKQVKNFIKSTLGISNKIVNGRDVEIKKLDNSIAKLFMDDNHIQGAPHTSLVCFGIFLNDMLLGAMSLGRHHRGTDNSVIVLDRLCFLDGTKIHGGASKLLKYSMKWAKQNGYTKIISWSDNRWSEGTVYEKMGFVLEEELKPDYFYIKERKVYSKQSLKKKGEEKTSGKTEKELRAEQGYERVYDCGKKRWVINLF